MPNIADARIHVSFADHPGPAGAGPVAWLVEGVGTEGAAVQHFASGWHAAGCACCGGRAPVAEAFSRLFLRRARGELEFARVLVAVRSEAGRRAVLAALQHDAFVAARFRAAPQVRGSSEPDRST